MLRTMREPCNRAPGGKDSTAMKKETDQGSIPHLQELTIFEWKSLLRVL